MKTTIRMITTVAALLGSTHLANAASRAHADGSQLAIWIFLGMCALIIVVQIFPMIFMAYGLLKGMIKGRKQGADVTAEVVVSK